MAESPRSKRERFDATRSVGVALAACGSDLNKKIRKRIGAEAPVRSPSLPGDVDCIVLISVLDGCRTKVIESVESGIGSVD